MDNFLNNIKNVLENYELPYDENSWEYFRKIYKNKKRYNILKYLSISVFTIICFIFTLFYTSNSDNMAMSITKNKNMLNIKEHVSNNNVFKNVVNINNVNKSEFNVSEYSYDVVDTIDYDLVYITPDTNVVDIKDGVMNNIDTNMFISENIINIKEVYSETPNDSTDTTVVIPTSLIYYVPNAFSPNGDGINDEFYVIGNLTNSFQLLIYDRWGNLVFETMNPEYRWNGGSCKPGLYFWIFRYQDDNGIIHTDNGYVILIK